MSCLAYPRLQQLIASAKNDLPLGVVYPLSAPSLETVRELLTYQLCTPILLGPKQALNKLAGEVGLDLQNICLIDTPDDPVVAAKIAVEMVHQGKLAALMKGSQHTEDLMGPVVERGGLRTERRTSHLFLFELANYPKLLGISDCVVNIAPNASQKQQILLSSLEALDRIGINNAKVAIIAATEVVNSAMPATLDAKTIVDAHRIDPIFSGAVIEGPLGFDNALSTLSAQTKGIESIVAGEPDLLLVPDLQVGNILYKALIYMAGAECAGVILGTQVPIILTSRADSIFSRVASTALAMRLAIQ